MTEAVRGLLKFSEEEEGFRKALASFCASEVQPFVAEMDEKAELKPDLVSKLFDLGVMGIEIPEQFGGAGSSFTMACLAIQEFAKVDASLSVLVDVQNTLVANALLRWGNEDQKKRYLPKMTSSWVGSYALSESSSGSDAFALKLRAKAEGDDYILQGQKLWITNAKESSLFLVFANLAPEKGHKGITCFIVEKGMEGFSIGKKEDKLGIRASSTCELIFENCRIPKQNILGEMGKGYKIAIETLNEGRIGIGAQMLGIAEGAYGVMLDYIKTREQFGKRLCDFQAVQFQVATMRTQLEAISLMVYNAARLKDSGAPFIKEAAMAKLYASQLAEEICSKSLELFGGNGFIKEYPIEKFYRDVKIGSIYEGTSNMQLQTIAKLEL